jgi:predicted nucleic acid-binding protein
MYGDYNPEAPRQAQHARLSHEAYASDRDGPRPCRVSPRVDRRDPQDVRNQDHVTRPRPVTRGAPKYVLDTQLFINAFRDPAANHALEKFHREFAPFEHLSVVVAQELRAGAGSPGDRQAVEQNVLSAFVRPHRVITPSAAAWHRSGDVLAAMAKQEGLELSRVSKAFGNDILLAASCREAGCVLITDNVRDFSRIQRFIDFAFIKPWPGAIVAG